MAPNKTVLITGCSAGGIGASLALEFHRQGLHVFATARSLEKMASLEAVGITCLALDTTSAGSIQAALLAVEKAISAMPSSDSSNAGLNYLVNNAGLTRIRPFMDSSIADLQRVMDTNVMGTMAVTHAFLPLLVRAKGVIATVGSVNEVYLPPLQSTYNASKAAVHAWGDSLRIELKPLGVRVVTIVTGAVRSNLMENEAERNRTGGGRGDDALPEGSYYKALEKNIHDREFLGTAQWQDGDVYARDVVAALLREEPKRTLWLGGMSTMAWVLSLVGWEGMMVSSFIGIKCLLERGFGLTISDRTGSCPRMLGSTRSRCEENSRVTTR